MFRGLLCFIKKLNIFLVLQKTDQLLKQQVEKEKLE